MNVSDLLKLTGWTVQPIQGDLLLVENEASFNPLLFTSVEKVNHADALELFEAQVDKQEKEKQMFMFIVEQSAIQQWPRVNGFLHCMNRLEGELGLEFENRPATLQPCTECQRAFIAMEPAEKCQKCH